ncbi:peroxide stress protein YaaA [Streptococcus hongkongensis]|nr:hypothetical protein NC01_08390 [Streptococcus uberis]
MLKFLIPTAKEMKVPTESFPPLIPKLSQPIVEKMAELSVEQLAAAYKMNPEAALKELIRIREIHQNQAPTYPAYKLFNGLMYRFIKRDNLSPREKDYLINHTYITSSLYGVIPMDFPIAEHRLDFLTKIKIGSQSLKAYWRPHYDQLLSTENVYISLLSSEFEEVFSTDRRKLWISISFLEEKNGSQKSHSTISKKARGAFLTAAMEANCQKTRDLKSLEFNDFSYCDSQSTSKNYVYIKKEA